jgi:hypothetical protein
MSEKDQDKRKPLEPEIVQEDENGSAAPRPSGLGQVRYGEVDNFTTGALGSVFNVFRSPKREARQARDLTDLANANKDLNEAVGDLVASKEKLKDLDAIIAKDKVQRQVDLVQAQADLAQATNKKDEEERIGRLKRLQDTFAEEELHAQIAEARRRRQQAENPPPPVDENIRRRAAIAAKFREKLGTRYTEQEIRAHAAREIAEIRQRAGDGPLSESDEREIRNITDAMNDLLNEL